jgi:hypothetical protein
LLQILELLQKVEQTMDQGEMEDMVGVKEEPSESPILEGVLGEGKVSFIQAV